MRNNPYLIALVALLTSTQFFASAFAAEANKTDKTEKDRNKIMMERIMVIGDAENAANIPGSAQFIDKETLDDYSYTDINNVLKQVPGVNILQEDGFGNRPNIGFRGGRVNRSANITLMEDGVLIAPAPYSAPSAYYFPRVSRMEAVEVRKGSSTIEFGPRTTSGALNLISSSTPEKMEFEVKAGYGSFNTNLLQIHQGNKIGNFSYVVDIGNEQSDGFKTIDVVGGDTGYSIQDVMTKFKLTTDDDADIYQSIELKLGYSHENSDETYLGLTDQDFQNDPYRRYAASQFDNMKSDHEQYQLRHFADFNSFDITTTLYRNDFSRNWYKLSTSVTDNSDQTGLNIRANNRDYYSQGIQSVVGTELKTGDLDHKLKFSARYHMDEESRFHRDDTYSLVSGVMNLTNLGVDGGSTDRDLKSKALALFVSDAVNYKKLTVTPGLRYENIRLEKIDYLDNTQNNVNNINVYIPGIDIIYKFNDNFSSFTSVHKGFAPPTPGTANPQEEDSTNYELGFRYNKNSFKSELVGFYNDYSNLLGECTLSSGGGCTEGDQFNAGGVSVSGFEASTSYNLAKSFNITKFRLPVSVNYTFTKANFENSFTSEFSEWSTVTSGDELPYIAKDQFYVSVGLIRPKWELHLNGKYVGKMRATAGSGDIHSSEAISSNFIIDFASEFEIRKKIRLFINVENVTDEQYMVSRRPIGARPGKPLAIMTGIKYKF